jgi:2-oxoglutarate dehydrogenase E1 component
MSQEASGNPKLSYASGANAEFIDSLYEQYKKDSGSVDATWQRFFEGFEFGLKGDAGTNAASAGSATGGDPDTARVEAFINAYRRLGHMSAHLNPLVDSVPISPDMTPEAHGLKNLDATRRFMPANLPKASLTFPEINSLLTKTYCGKIGADYRDLNDIETITWLQEQMESCANKPEFPSEFKKRIHQKLAQAEGFEQFLGRRYIGAKRFSIEGCDALIPLLDVILDDASRAGAEEVSIGMAHRGRLNVLANIMNKPAELILKEFEGAEFNPYDIDGDVKYHMGFASDVGTFSGNRMRLYLSPNPSHLEVVSPVVEGFVRARQRLLADTERTRIIPILMHGDASFMGQGVVAETFNMCQLDSYKTGGTIHIVINNQIGFTTDPVDSRSTDYSSDIAKMVRAPVLHVNADDPEAVAWCAKLATSFRQKFSRDIIIDLVGYRRHGHNEGDEPAFTQPVMYKKISVHTTVYKKYTDRLIAEGTLTEEGAKKVADEFKDYMQIAYDTVHGKKTLSLPAPVVPASLQKCMTYRKATRDDVAASVKTGVSAKTLKDIVQKMTTIPAGFTLNPKLVRLLENRRKMLDDGGAVDWGLGELMALATLALEGHHIRLTGQDAKRGTFTSRHSVYFDFETNKQYEALSHLSDTQGKVHVINSPLSEMGCLGYEFGYSVADPEAFVAWEAQFGDFSNGAQIVIDQFLSASEAKWKQTSGLVMLLPHGHEGQGPEHSSARPERFLQLCGNLNLQVAICTTPAQHFHILRRQLHREFRKPLVLMTPKSLLREPLCTSTVADFEKGFFKEILDDESIKKKAGIKKAIFCSGKIYYDLFKARAADEKFKSVPIVRLEQLYPFPYASMTTLLETFPNLEEIIWTQEEPQNMGGWNFVRGRLLEVLKTNQKLSYSGRKNSGTPAEGTTKAHEAEQNRIIQDALGRAQGGTVATMRKSTES